MDVQEAINQKARDLRAEAVERFGADVLTAFRILEVSCHVNTGSSSYYPGLRPKSGDYDGHGAKRNERTIDAILKLIMVSDSKYSIQDPIVFLDEQIAKYLASDLLTNAAVRLQTIGDDHV